MRYKNSLRLLSLGFLATCVQKSYAKCGNVDYSWGLMPLQMPTII